MKIGVVGLGYVGIVTAAVLAANKNEVVCIDVDRNKVERLKSGDPVIYEPGLEDMVKKNTDRMLFSLDYKHMKGCVAVFLSVPTPTRDGKADLSYVIAASNEMAKVNKNAVLIIKSTVLPGTAAEVSRLTGLTVISNPEFTKEGTAVVDTLHPDRIVIGGRDERVLELVERIWSFTRAPVLKTTNENAELIKYASNAFLATKISFINEIANVAERVPGADVNVIAEGMGYDKRISPYFLRAGIGYGGSCLPKDTMAFSSFAKGLGESLQVVEAAMRVNEKRVDRVISLVKKHQGDIKGKRIAVLGISFKDNTNDVRESRAVALIERLVRDGADVRFYDPKVKHIVDPDMGSSRSMKEAIAGADTIVIATEWNEFKDLKPEDKNSVVIDAKRILDSARFKKFGAIGLYGDGKD